jgi:hypothetical protein
MARLHSTSESRSFKFPDWQREFETAMQENHQTQRPEGLQKARAAIFLRLKAMATRPPGIVERIALNDAIHLLRILRSEVLPNRDWDIEEALRRHAA